MGLFDFIKSQFIEVIEWSDTTSDQIVYRFPVQNKEIKMGASLTVRVSQMAVFVNEGVIADVFGPGKYSLSTENIPVLTKIKSWPYGFNSPFKAEVYFINTKQFTDQKWGTQNPIMMRDAEFGMVRIRAFGNYAYKVTDGEKFMKEVFGTLNTFEVSQINGQLKRMIVSGLSDLISESKISAIDLASYYDELSSQMTMKMEERFAQYGLDITSLYIENISLPEEVEKVLDQRTSMGVIGDMNKFTKYQTAQAIKDAANNEGSGIAGIGAGVGAGAAIGSAMTNAMNSNSSETKILCPNCKTENPENAKFCISCGEKMNTDEVSCVSCNKPIGKGVKFCPECGASQKILCSKCNAEISGGVKFCPECGERQ